MRLHQDSSGRFLVMTSAFVTSLLLFVSIPNFSAAAETEESVPAPQEPSPEPEESAPPPQEPSPEPEDTWAVVDPETGNVLNIIVCTESMCGKDGVTGGKLEDGETGIVGNLVRQGSQSQGGWRSGGGHQVTWQEEEGSFLVESNNGVDSSSSMRVVPRQGEDFVYKDIGTTNRFNSGDETATLRTNRSDFENPIVEVELEFPGLGQNGRLLSYWLELHDSGGDDARRALDQIGSDVDSILVEEGFTVEQSDLDDDSGERLAQNAPDGNHPFVGSIRKITAAVVGFLGGLLGLN